MYKYTLFGLSDPLSSALHLFGGVVALLAGLLFVRVYAKRPRLRLARGIYVAATANVLFASGIYHSVDPTTHLRMVLQRIDHASIFLLVAATITVFVTHLLPRRAHRGLLPVWLFAVAGIVVKTIFFEAIPYALGVSMYFLVASFGVGMGLKVKKRLGMAPLKPIIWGAAAYAIGAFFDVIGWPVLVEGVVGPHELLHAFVLVGMAIHWGTVMSFLRDQRRFLPQVKCAVDVNLPPTEPRQQVTLKPVSFTSQKTS